MKTVILDFDGTVADSFDFVFDFLVKEAGHEPIHTPGIRDSYRQLSMIGIARRLGIPWLRLPLLLMSGRREMASRMLHVKPVEGMLDVIEQLHGHGYQLMILSTNSATTIRKFLDQYKIEDYFEKVVGNVGIFGKAPALRRLTKSYRLSSTDCIYVGDEVRDIEASSAAGMRSIGVTWGFADERFLRLANPYKVVTTPGNLIAVILAAEDL
ncbi:MAG: gph 1 [Candidatus Saccharibacteria bacterium]|nr:gph 1 [Candidatus Saccharibacteria bacterium]